jgi:O-antigen ligase
VSEGVAPGRVAIAAIVLIAVAVLVARGVTGVPVNHALAVAAAGALFILVFMRTELGLDVLLLSMLLSPEVVLGGKGGIAEQREVSIRLDDFIILIIAFTWFAKNAVYKELGLVQRTPLNRPIAAYATACLLATVWGVLWGRVSALSGLFYLLKYLEYFFVFYIVVNNVRTRQQARRLLSVALLTAALVSVVGIAQIPSGQRVSAPFEGESGEPNTLGGYLILMMAVAAGIASETRRAAVRLAGFGLALLMLVPFAYTLSRASYLALIPMSLCLVVLSSRRALLVPTFILALAAAPLVAPPVMRERIEYTFRPQANQPTVRVGQAGFDPSTSERLLSFKDALDAWTTKPLLGFGVTGFRFMDAQYPRTLVETGVVGFAAFAWMLWTLLRLAVSRLGAARGAESRGLVLGYLAGFVGLLVHAIGSNTFIIIRIMEPFWFLTGLVVVLPDLEAAPEAPPRSPPPSVRAIPPAPLRVALSPGSAGRRGG